MKPNITGKEAKDFQEHTCLFNVKGEEKRFVIKDNMTDDECYAALVNWVHRTEDYTAQSFCNYINSKGMHKAMPK